MHSPFFRSWRFLCCWLMAAGTMWADRIDLADGSVIHGRLVSADAGKLKVETAFAGVIQIAQDQVQSLETDGPVNVSLADGSTRVGRIGGAADGLAIEGDDGREAADPGEITSIWQVGSESPAARLAREVAEKARRKWAIETSFAVNGRTGTREKFNSSFGFKATLGSSHDRLILNLLTEQAQDRGVKTADRQSVGVDYSSFYSKDNGWYVRTTLENDTVKSIDLRSLSSFGYSRKLVRRAPQELEFRFGASYLHEYYGDGTDFESPGLDLTLLNTYRFKFAKLQNSLTYTPAFKNFANYRLRHESGLELPLTAALWKLKIGMTNEYQSRPPGEVERLDTTYITSLILNWK